MTTPTDKATDIKEHHPADHLCGQNHNPSMIRFARKCWQSGYESASPRITALEAERDALAAEVERLREELHAALSKNVTIKNTIERAAEDARAREAVIDVFRNRIAKLEAAEAARGA